MRRSARIVNVSQQGPDDLERRRERLLDRVLRARGRIEITRAVNDYVAEGFELPEEQGCQMQLLEHNDEARVRAALEVIEGLVNGQPIAQATLLENRLRRLEEYADEPATRDAAASLRRRLRERTDQPSVVRHVIRANR